jgi:D-alanyl-lipoteichoic acid acyltransferase DltB (MBOAT superfamily)
MLATLWSGAASSVPMLKGPSHARQVEAVDVREFAVTQLKGVKLLAWTMVLVLVSVGIQYLLLRANVPTLEDAIDRNLTGTIPVWLCWASLTGSFVLLVITLTIWGHTVVGGLRLLGFKALRNTYAPFRARTIAEFWNRIYFYFKELLVDHFYYPVYLRYFKRSPRLRTVFATFAAAGFGNAFYHFGRDVNYVAELGLWRALAGFQVYLFYTIVLATGISISQLRGKRRQTSWFRTEVVSRVTIVLFYGLVHIFDDTRRTVSLGAHFAFLFRLFSL